MNQDLAITPELARQIDARAIDLRAQYQQAQWKQIDRMFAVLLVLQWFAGVCLAIWISPRAWDGLDSYIHPHIWAAVYLGGLIAAFPIALVIFCPGEAITRYTIATAQMMHSAMLIHLSGGRIETHFHVFGSLAFLSFYRDWRVLIPATVVVALDHALRGIFWPESVFGIAATSPWRWTEHAAWVVFEDIILVWACIRGANELAKMAKQQAELETINRRVEAEVARQTSRLESVSQELIGTARRAGMAEIATGVLHNVGNVLNSVNVSANVALKKLKESEVSSLVKVRDMLQSHEENMAGFLTADERGKQLPGFLIDLTACLDEENRGLMSELESMAAGLDHIKQIVGAQQQHAKSGVVRERVVPGELFDQAISMDLGMTRDQAFTIERNYEEIGPVVLDKHKLLQILINLLSNAKKAVVSANRAEKKISVSIRKFERDGTASLQFEVGDNGVGISPENLTRIFTHGFTTRQEGHGFGLHSAANTATELGGKLSVASDGVDQGARFTLEIPIAGISSVEQILLDKKKRA